MIKSLKITNFRSVKEQVTDLTPIVFLYGNNASGKSSLFYSLNVLRNIVSNPGQPLDKFFDLGFANLGGFKQIVFRHDDTKSVSISIAADIENTEIEYGVKLNPKGSSFFLNASKPYTLKLTLPVTFPYALNENIKEVLVYGGVTYNVSWNGVIAQVSSGTVTDESTQQSKNIATILNKAAGLIRTIDLVPLRRGFTKPQYGVVNVSQFPVSEDDVASLLSTDEYLDGRVSTYLEQIIDRQFRAKPQSGTSVSALTTIEKESKITSDIVNDGFGVNQLVYLLAKILNKGANTLCIEEPEINLHPGVVRRLPSTLIELVKNEKKQLLISTHSENLVIAMLSSIAKGEIRKENIYFYLTARTNGITNFIRQTITDNGQVEGGLTSFMAGELEDINAFFKAKKSKRNKKIDKENKDINTLEKGELLNPKENISKDQV